MKGGLACCAVGLTICKLGGNIALGPFEPMGLAAITLVAWCCMLGGKKICHIKKGFQFRFNYFETIELRLTELLRFCLH